MTNHDEIIQLFLQSYNFTEENEDVIGVLFYGSRKYNTNSDDSDIDLLIITDSPNNYKCVTYIDDIKIEYSKKNIYNLLDQIANLEQSSDRYLVSVFTNGTIIFSRDGMLEHLKEEVLNRSNIIKKRRSIVNPELNDWFSYFNSLDCKNKLFDFTYHNLVENIRKTYHEKNGFSKTPDMKTYQLYTDREYASKYYCVMLPDQEFIDTYLELIVDGYNEEKLMMLVDEVIVNDLDSGDQFMHFSKNALKYRSTIVFNSVSKCCTFLEDNHPASLHDYYITLEKVRKLYCNINDIDDGIEQFGYEYDSEFLDLFNSCLETNNRGENIKKLFEFVSKPLDIDYKDYKVLVAYN